MTPRLSVNVDHVATLREARGVDYPSPTEAAGLAERAGADGITVHLRSDRRHIQDRDVETLKRTVSGKLNLEMAVEDEMLAVACGVRPDQATLVPERSEEITTEGGLNLAARFEEIAEAAARLEAESIAVSLFLDPEPNQIAHAAKLAKSIVGFELNTDQYTKGSDSPAELERLIECARLGAEGGLEVYAGHGLTVANVGEVAGIPEIQELNIGHSIVSRSVLIGMEAAVREMLAAMSSSPGPLR